MLTLREMKRPSAVPHKVTNSFLVKFALAATTGLAAAAVGLFLSVGSWKRMLFALFAAFIACLGLRSHTRKPIFAFYVLIVLAVAMPCEFGGAVSRAPIDAPFCLALAICILWMFDVGFLHRGVPVVLSGIILAAISFVSAVIISFVLGQSFALPAPPASMGAQLIQLFTFVGSIGLFLAAGHLIRVVDELRRLTWLFISLGAVTCAVQVITGYGPVRNLGGSALDNLDRLIVSGSIGSLFWVWLVAVSLSQAVFNKTLTTAARLACVITVVLALFRGIVLARSWVSGWLPALVALSVVLLLKVPRLMIIATAVAVLSWLYLAPPAADTFVPTGEEYSQMTRAEAARVLQPLIMKSPLVGFGPANYYSYTQLSPILGWYVKFNSHNQYLDLLAQIGVVGGGAFLWLVWEIAAIGWHSFRSFRGGFCQSYSAGLLAGLAGTIVAGALADWIIPFYFNIGVRGFRSSLLFWVFAGGVLVLKRVGEERASSERAAV